MPHLSKDERERLAQISARMLSEAQAAEGSRMFSATGFARSHISILHQQMRCANLAWALNYSRKLAPGDVIGIIGGSFSGLSLAVSLAACNDVIVYVFEKEEALLHQFLDKGHRFISPNLNSRALRKAFDPEYTAPFYDPPIFRWSSGPASRVAANWVSEFRRYSEKLPIFCLLGTEVQREEISERGSKVIVQPNADDHDRSDAPLAPIELDWLIDATGYGPEHARFTEINDFSYWGSGHRLIYDYLLPGSRVLISGCGDSGLIESMHYALRDFSHDKIGEFWPNARHLDLAIDEVLERASFDDVTAYEDDTDLPHFPLASELRWFYGICRREADAYSGGPDDLDDRRRLLFDTIERQFLSIVRNESAKIRKGDYPDYLRRLPQLLRAEQGEILKSLNPVLDNLSSAAISEAMETINVSKIFNIRELHSRKRLDTQVTLNGRTPFAFTRQLSPYNVWLMRVMLTFPNVKYRSGEIKSIKRRSDNAFDVRFSGGAIEVYDRVITRYGPNTNEYGLLSPKSDAAPTGWLLVEPIVRTRQGGSYRLVDLARRDIQRACARVLKRRVSRRPDHQVLKDAVVLRLSTPPKFRKAIDGLDRHSQSRLVEIIKSGARPRFFPQASI